MFRSQDVLLVSSLAVANALAWVWAFWLFFDRMDLLGTAVVVYGLGLRHAVDADHIAAIDNVTSKLVQAGQRPVGVGFFFSAGHSAVVIVVACLVASAVSTLAKFEKIQLYTGIIGTCVSIFFLFAIALMNVLAFSSTYRAYRLLRAGGSGSIEDSDVLLNARGFLTKIFQPLFRMVSKSWHMFPLGVLFGLGFDTATEVAMFGVSAAQAVHGVSLSWVLIFPILFALGMSLVDTLDGVVMLRAYSWAFIRPLQKVYYNMTITLVSIVVAIFIGLAEVVGLCAAHFGADSPLWSALGRAVENLNNAGFFIIGLFVLIWTVFWGVYKLQEGKKARA